MRARRESSKSVSRIPRHQSCARIVTQLGRGFSRLSGTHSAERLLPLPDYAALLRALNFAAHKHRDQRRKGNHQAPYINHPIEVATLLATYGGITDVAVLQAAILHDTIEDTDTTAEELEREFGADVTALVLEMTDDMSMPSGERKRHQAARAPGLSSRAKCIKLADKIANVGDIGSQPPPDWSLHRRRTYFAWTAEVIGGCRGVNEGLERRYDEVLKEAQRVTG
jgi:(p)ppGpp synthase/HD superfamily hydrolase